MSWLKYSIAFSIPLVTAIGAVTMFKPSWFSAFMVKSEPTAEVRPFQILDYPPTPPLLTLPREWVSASLVNGNSLDSTGGLQLETAFEPESEYTGAQRVIEVSGEPIVPEWNLDDIDLSSLSPELALKVESALINTDSQSEFLPDVYYIENTAPTWHGKLPALDFQAHMYASNERRRWVKVNGKEYHQGDDIGDGIYLSEILPQAVIIEFTGKRIRIPALYEWKG